MSGRRIGFSSKLPVVFCALMFCAMAAGPMVLAQSAVPETIVPPASNGGGPVLTVVQASQSGAQDKAAADTILTKDQQKEVLSKLDSILKFVSADSKLEIKRPVKGVIVSREQVNAELRKKFDEDEGAKRMERSELVLKKFGLLDRDFQLKPFLLSLLTEQIAGFYDDKTRVMNLLNWVPLSEQEPVMAHELTHALQDQRVGLEKWEDQEVKGVAQNVSDDNAHIAKDEAETAREAVAEGEAMVTFADYALKDTGKTLKDVPQMGEQLQNGAGDTSGSPVLARAPLVLQQALLFPYTAGLGFEQALLIKGGTERAFAQTLDAPPSSSFEILNPEQYLAQSPVPVLRMPDVHPLLQAAGYAPYDVGVMGELDVRMMTELFGGQPMAAALAPAWAGGIYLAAQKKSATEAQKQTTASLGLMYASRWKNAASARDFFTVYDGQLPRKYEKLVRRKADEADDSERVYSTEEGDVLLTLKDDGVFVSEGFDVAMARKMRDMVDAAQGVGPLREAGLQVPGIRGQGLGIRDGGLVNDLSQWLGSFGVMRAALTMSAAPFIPSAK